MFYEEVAFLLRKPAGQHACRGAALLQGCERGKGLSKGQARGQERSLLPSVLLQLQCAPMGVGGAA